MFINIGGRKINADTIKSLKDNGSKTILEYVDGEYTTIDDTIANVTNVISVDADWLLFVSASDDINKLLCINQMIEFSQDNSDADKSVVKFKDGKFEKVGVSTAALDGIASGIIRPGEGQPGAPGTDGTSISWKGEFQVHPSDPIDGWAYKNTTDGKSYIYQSGAWFQMTIDGVDGQNGVDGQDGQDGISISWKGAATDPTIFGVPQKGWVYRNINDSRIYIRNDDNTAWELMVLDGSDGADGAVGLDGNSVFITYNDNPIFSEPLKPADGTDGTAGGWHTDATSSVRWMSQKVAASATDGSWGQPILLTGQDGQNGISIEWKGELFSAPADPQDKWVYKNTTNNITYIYNAGTLNWEVMVVDGSDGADGADAVNLYTWIKYADDINGANISDSPTGKAYIGIAYNKTVQAESSDPLDYTWALIKGDQGIQGEPGADGADTYTWIKYGDDVNGSNLSDSPTGKDYIGIAYNKTVITESNNPADYTWSLFRGSDGAPGADGLSIFITYNDSSVDTPPSAPTGDGTTGGWHTDATTSVKWISQKIAATASTGTWGTPFVMVGADGSNGADGQDGSTGTAAPYLELNSNGGIFFVKTEGSDPAYATSWTQNGLLTLTATSNETVTWVSTGLSTNLTGTGGTRYVCAVADSGTPYISSTVATITASIPSGISKTLTIRKIDAVDGTYIGANGIYTGNISADQINAGILTGRTIQTDVSPNERFVVSADNNEAQFYGDRGDGTIEKLVSIGINGSSPSDYLLMDLGSVNTTQQLLRGIYSGAYRAMSLVSYYKAALSITRGTNVVSSSSNPCIYAYYTDNNNGQSAAGISIDMAATGVGNYSKAITALNSGAPKGWAGLFNSYAVDGIGVRAVATSTGGYGVNASGGIADYIATGTGTYTPFTGAHDGFILKSTIIVPGDIVCDEQILFRKNISGTVSQNKISTLLKEKAAVGVYAISAALDLSEINTENTATLSGFMQEYSKLQLPPALEYDLFENLTAENFDQRKVEIETLLESYEYFLFNAVGEGQINVCSEGGDIETGDYICSSSTPGKGMKQSDDLLHNYTVAKARESVTWTQEEIDNNTVKQIACTYHCG